MSVQKIDLPKTIEWLIEEFQRIEAEEPIQHKKTKYFQALASKFITKLHNDGRRSSQQKVTLKTARGYITKARDAIRDITGIHHRFGSELSRLMKKYPRNAEFLDKLSGLTNTTEASDVKSGLLKVLSSAHELRSNIDSLDFSKRTITGKIKKLAEKYPAYAYYINNLDTSDSVILAKTELIKAINEAKPLYEELKALKIDHELIVSLKLPAADSAFFKKDKDDRLAKKKTTVVFVDYPRYMDQITTVLENPEAYFNGFVSGIAPLTFALCAASGRRSIEILLVGEFVARGKYGLGFTGAAKKREKDNTEHLIYSLVDSATFVHALNVLRNHAVTRKVISESEPRDHFDTNEIIKGKVAPHLNEFTKNFFIDKKRVSKDTRGIYGRICHEKWFATDPRWKIKDEDIFASELYIHNDKGAQAHYKPYKLNNYVSNYKATVLDNIRWQALCDLDEDMETLARGNAAIDIHDWVKAAVEQNPNVEINQSTLVRETKKFRGTIQNYLEAIGDLASPGEPLTNQALEDEDDELLGDETESTTAAKHPLPFDGDKGFEKTAGAHKKQPVIKKDVEIVPAKKERPHFSTKSLADDNQWQVIIKLNNKTKAYDLYADTRVLAMTLAYELFNGITFEFDITIPYKNGPQFRECVYAKTENEAIRKALNDAGLDGFKGTYGKIQTKKL